MKITKLESQKKDSFRVSVFVDEEFYCGLSLTSVAHFSLYAGKEIDENELKDILEYDLEQRLFDRAIEVVSKNPKTAIQVKQYLRSVLMKKNGIWYTELDKESAESIIDRVVQKLDEYGYVNDERFAEMFINDRLENRPRGKSLIISELISKGVDKDTAVQKVEELIPDEYRMLVDVYEKKYHNEKISRRDSKKISFLLRKGFSWDLIDQFISDDTRE